MRNLTVLVCVLALQCGRGELPAPSASSADLERPEGDSRLKTGLWRVVLASPGGDLPFSMEVSQEGEGYRAWVLNGEERVLLDRVGLEGDDEVVFGISHYESYFHGRFNAEGDRIEGEWRKVAGPEKTARLPFYAQYGRSERFIPARAEMTVHIGGRWAVTFDNSGGEPQEAVAEFRQEGSRLTGTFLTTTGDYRYLEGMVDGSHFYLSCFDGGHAFLFKGRVEAGGGLSGDFWSRDSWHEGWQAKRDEDAALPDPFGLTALKDGLQQFRFSFPDLEGNIQNQDAPFLQGKVRLITIFGSWCPNCNDEAPFLQGLYDTYKDRGFQVLGLAFEMTEDRERGVRVLKRFQKRHGINYPILLAGGTTDKAENLAALPDLTRLLAYPTTVLIDREGKVAAIHTGFSGPGTGPHFELLKARYQEKIEALL